MKSLIVPIAVTLAAGALTGDAPAPAGTVSPETLAMLDPSRLAAQMCGARRGGALRARLLLAAAVQTGAAAPPAVQQVAVPDAIRLPVTSADPEVRRWVRQGLLLAYGFNHGAAIHAFREAQRRDPQCAICFWGEAYALGPNINAPMEPRGAARRRSPRRPGRGPSPAPPRRPSRR